MQLERRSAAQHGCREEVIFSHRSGEAAKSRQHRNLGGKAGRRKGVSDVKITMQVLGSMRFYKCFLLTENEMVYMLESTAVDAVPLS